MAKFVTYIADAELESDAIKAINTINGELVSRIVSAEQVTSFEKDPEIILITNREVSYSNKQVFVDRFMSTEEIAKELSPEQNEIAFNFQKGRAKVISFVGLSGGVGTTSIAINFAFESAMDSNVLLVDLDQQNPDIAISLGLHRIENRPERISKNLQVMQGLPKNIETDLYIFDLGNNLQHPILKQSDEIYLLTRLTFNTLIRMNSLEFTPYITIFNLFEKSSFQQHVRRLVEDQYPRMNFASIPLDTRSFEKAASAKSALVEVAANSLARKSIATLG